MSVLPLVSIVIPTLGKSAHLRGILERIQRQQLDISNGSSNACLIETLVVANVPSQTLRKSVQSIGTVPGFTFEYLETGRIGVNIARNKGLDRSRSGTVLFLDDDAILDDDRFVSRHLLLHAQHPEAAAIGGPYRLAASFNKWDQAYHDIAHEWIERQKHHRDKTSTGQLLGGNLSLKKSKLTDASLRFDEEIRFGGAESGLCQRLTARGEQLLFFNDLVVGHAPQMSLLSFCRKAYLQGAGSNWRSMNLPKSEVKYLCEKQPRPANSFRKSIYKFWFDFGFSSGPSSKIRKVQLLLFILARGRVLEKCRRLYRQSYAALASAWLHSSR